MQPFEFQPLLQDVFGTQAVIRRAILVELCLLHNRNRGSAAVPIGIGIGG